MHLTLHLLLLLASNKVLICLAASGSHQIGPAHTSLANAPLDNHSTDDAARQEGLQQDSNSLSNQPSRDSTGSEAVEMASNIAKMSAIQQRKLYFFALKNLVKPTMTEQQWTEMQHNEPEIVAQVYKDFAKHGAIASLRAHYRRQLEKRPNDKKLLSAIAANGFTVDSIKSHHSAAKYADTPQEARIRAILSNRLKRLKLEINLINKNGYFPKKTEVDRIGQEAFEDRYLVGHGQIPTQVEADMIQAIKLIDNMRRTMRSSPFDPSLMPSKDKLQLLLQKTMKRTKVIELPRSSPRSSPVVGSTEQDSELDRTSVPFLKRRRATKRISRLTLSPSHESSSSAHGSSSSSQSEVPSSGPLFLNAMHQKYDTLEKKRKYIDSLFDTGEGVNGLSQKVKVTGQRTARKRARHH
jgi:hypothetical protein